MLADALAGRYTIERDLGFSWFPSSFHFQADVGALYCSVDS
jgi:hypothetical protein